MAKKIICWNVNGIRASVKKGAFDEILSHNPDILCLQETKAHPDQLDAHTRSPQGYSSYFDHSKLKKGYSGVVIYTKETPTNTLDSLKLNDGTLDQEGRFIQVGFPMFTLINCYFPNGGGAKERLDYKINFYDAMLKHIQTLVDSGGEVIVCGDFNIVHKENDAARFKENQGNVGFLPEEQAKLDALVRLGLSDVFRVFNPEASDVFTWWDMKTAARDRNIGWRIDTFFATKKILKKIKSIEIHGEVYGSDHCPVSIEIE